MQKMQKNWPKNCEFNYKLMIITRLQETRLTYKKIIFLYTRNEQVEFEIKNKLPAEHRELLG